MVQRPTNARSPFLLRTWDNGSEADKRQKCSRTTTQRPSTYITALSVRISSFGNGTPETADPIHRQKQQPLFSVGSCLSPLTRRVASESSYFGLGICHRTHLLSTPFRRFRHDRTTLSRPPFNRTGCRAPLSRPPPLPPRRTCRIPHALLHPDVLPRAVLLRSPPIQPIPRPTTCTLLTTRDPTEPMCSGPVFHAEDHCLAMFPTDSRIASIPFIWLGCLPRHCHRSILDTADHVDKAAALLVTIWLVLLSTNVGAPTATFSRQPCPEPPGPYQTTNGTSRPAIQFTHQRTHADDDFSVFPNQNKPTFYRS